MVTQNIQITQLIPATILLFIKKHYLFCPNTDMWGLFVCLRCLVLPSYIICEVDEMSLFFVCSPKKVHQTGEKEKQQESSEG